MNITVPEKYKKSMQAVLMLPLMLSTIFAISHILAFAPFFLIIAELVEQGYGLIRILLFLVLIYGAVGLVFYIWDMCIDGCDEVYMIKVVFIEIVLIFFSIIAYEGGIW